MNKYKEALNFIYSQVRSDYDEYMQGGNTEAYHIIQELIDKETPMLVKIWERAQPATRCPICGRGIEKYGDDNYCPNCGQLLKWSEDND